jgi:hypothetical protein
MEPYSALNIHFIALLRNSNETLQYALIGLVISVRLYQLQNLWADFHEKLYRENSVYM